MADEYSTIEDALQALKEGRVIIVVDDEHRENEGDFVVAAEKATPEIIEFMITHGRGQVCMPILPEVAARLQLGGDGRPQHRAASRRRSRSRSTTCPAGRGSAPTERAGRSPRWSIRRRSRRICSVPGTCFRWSPRKGACSAGLGTPRRPSTWRAGRADAGRGALRDHRRREHGPRREAARRSPASTTCRSSRSRR